ncbi:tail protein [Enterococcus phage VRE9_2]
MATSGEKYTAFARHRLNCRWSINRQDIAGNYTIVTGFLYLQSMDAYGAIQASAVGQAQVTINGQKQTENATSQLSARQNKLLLAKDYRVGHNNDGSKTTTVSGSYFVNVTFAGVYYGTISVGNFNASLPKIPRHSSLNAVPTFTVPNGCSFSISRQSNFTHNLTFWVQNRANPNLSDDSHWTYLTNVDNVATSGKFNFTDGQLATIAQRIKQFAGNGGNILGKVKLWTNGVSGLSQQRTVQIAHPAPVTPKLASFKLTAGNKLAIQLDNFQSNNKFKYDITFKCAGWTKSWNNVTTNKIDWTLTQDEVNNILQRFTGASKNGFAIEANSKLAGSQYRNTVGSSGSAEVDTNTASPLITEGFSHEDTNQVSIAITGNKKILLDKNSTLRVTVPSSIITTRDYGKPASVEASFAGTKKTVNYAEGNMVLDFGIITGTTGNLTVTAIDSRGLKGSASYEVTVLPYNMPVINFNVRRNNSFETDTLVSGTSIWSPVDGKNKILSVQYQISGSDKVDIPFTTAANVLSITAQTLPLDNSQSWTVTIFITDKTGTYSRSYNITEGKPLMFIDPNRKSVSFGDFPTTGEERGLPGVIEIEAERYHDSGKTGIQMNNSDISGLNGIFFSNDTMNNHGEGLHFIKSGKPVNSNNLDDYDYVYMRDGSLYINNDSVPLFTINPEKSGFVEKKLWSGAWYIGNTQRTTISKSIYACPNGWALFFSKYSNGTASDVDSVCVLLHKATIQSTGTNHKRVLVSTYANTIAVKAFHIEDHGKTIVGSNDNNNSGEGAKTVLRAVYEW